MASGVPFVFLIKAQINLLTSIKWCALGCFLDYENQSPIDMINMEKRCKILDTGRKDANIQIGKRLSEYYGAAEPPVRCGESHLSGLTEPLRSL